MSVSNLPMVLPSKRSWNHGRILGQKNPLLPKHVWAIRVRLELAGAVRDLALLNMTVDSKLRGCDLEAHINFAKQDQVSCTVRDH